MKNVISNASVALFVTLLAVNGFCQNQQHWKIEHVKDEMTDRSVTSIVTVAEGATADAPFAVLGIGCSTGKNAEIAVSTEGRDYMPALTGKIEGVSRWYGQPSTEVRMRFDSNKATGHLEWAVPNAKTMVPWQGIGMSGRGLIKKLTSTTQFRVEYGTVSGEDKVLTFDVSGLMEAIKQVPECKVD
jgi:hypothetical protein